LNGLFPQTGVSHTSRNRCCKGEDSPLTPNLKIIFVFTHKTLDQVWEGAAQTLAAEGGGLKVISQMQSLDWNSVVSHEIPLADAVYLDVTSHFAVFNSILAAAKQAAYAVPAGIETELAWGAVTDRAAQLTIAAYLKGGTAEDLANAARWMLYKANKIKEKPAPPTRPVISGIYHPASLNLWDDANDYLAWADAVAVPPCYAAVVCVAASGLQPDRVDTRIT
jgi:cobaltochelatase CobN